MIYHAPEKPQQENCYHNFKIIMDKVDDYEKAWINDKKEQETELD